MGTKTKLRLNIDQGIVGCKINNCENSGAQVPTGRKHWGTVLWEGYQVTNGHHTQDQVVTEVTGTLWHLYYHMQGLWTSNKTSCDTQGDHISLTIRRGKKTTCSMYLELGCLTNGGQIPVLWVTEVFSPRK